LALTYKFAINKSGFLFIGVSSKFLISAKMLAISHTNSWNYAWIISKNTILPRPFKDTAIIEQAIYRTLANRLPAIDHVRDARKWFTCERNATASL